MRKASSDDATALQRGIGKVVLAQAVTTHLVKQVGKNPTRKYLVVRHLASGAHGRVELVQRLRDARPPSGAQSPLRVRFSVPEAGAAAQLQGWP